SKYLLLSRSTSETDSNFLSKLISPLLYESLPLAAGGRMAGEERRLSILRAAVALFSQRGFRGATTKEIAQAAGISEAMVFRHFATKEELYSAILDHKACLHDDVDPLQKVADAIARKDDRAVFEGMALDALDQHDCDPEFQRL